MSVEQYIGCLLLGGAGDALGYHLGEWEFNTQDNILKGIEELGGIDKIKLEGTPWIVSGMICIFSAILYSVFVSHHFIDDTVLHIATAEGMLAPATTMKQLIINVFQAYCFGMKKMAGRAPGGTCCRYLYGDKDVNTWNTVPFSGSGGGCGAAMRSMCIGLRFPSPELLPNLIITAIETGRLSHHHPTGYLGGVGVAAFTSYALQKIPLVAWGAKFRDEVIPLCKEHIKGMEDREPERNLEAFAYFEESVSFNGRGGASGHDILIIAYDCLLHTMHEPPEKMWNELLMHSAVHSGDSDSTAGVACSLYGAMYGIDGVNPLHLDTLEFRHEMRFFAKQLFEKAHKSDDPLNKPVPLGKLE
ncbi:putative ADP-ribosylarginine hydrolase [Monocercomonoides exilis]|uniref:putative ADP-ribosylarginine hydrolase n=1 Tax=Monocercomonoides exilis TaxID=2049356 RepID=UPI003559F0E0|nr:putative ADP-ribosylarginine hydrolase [Monocercomonoides exilis]